MKDDQKTKGKEELGESSVKKDEKKLSSAVSNKKIRKLAEAYMKKKGMTMLHPKMTFDVSPERGAKIAKAYEEMKHEPESPKVKKAYDALINETLDQWNEIRKTGLKATKITPDMGNPYPGGSKDVIKDIAENNHLFYFPTEQGYGSTDQQAANHPMLQNVKVDDEEVPANDIFRIVHDYFGHAKEGHGFGPQGEENAWMTHKQMYSPEAQKALTAETRGQNSWVNFGPMGEENRKNPEKTTYAEQKAGLLPDWVLEEVSNTGREKMAGGGRVMMQEGGDPAAMLPEPTVTEMPSEESEAPASGQEITPEIKRTHVPVWDMTGGSPKLTEISHDMVQEGIRNGQYAFDKNTQVPVIAPDDGKLYHISADEAQDAFSQGYRYADPKAVNQVKYGSGMQTGIAAAEAAARGLISAPLASALEHNILGVPKEEILGREEANPLLAKTVETAAFAAPLLLTGGAWAAEKLGAEAIGAGLKGAGQLAAKAPLPAALEKLGAVVPEGAKWYSKIGYGAARGAFEGALFQGNEEAGRAYLEDPDQTAGSIMASLGLGTVLGGALGFGFTGAGQAYKGVKGLYNKAIESLGGKATVPEAEKVLKTGTVEREQLEPPTPSEPTGPEGQPENPDNFIRVNKADIPAFEGGDTPTHVDYDPDIPEPAKQGLFKLLRKPDQDAAFTQYLWEKHVRPKNPKGTMPISMLSPHQFVHNMEQAVGEKFTGQTVRKNIDDVINAIHDSTVAITGEGERLSPITVGEELMENILQKHDAQDAIHARVFDEIRKHTEAVHLSPNSVEATANAMEKEFAKLKTADPATRGFLDLTLQDLRLKENIDDLKDFAATVFRRAQSASRDIKPFGEALARHIRALEETAINDFATIPNISPELRQTFEGLNAQRKEINNIFAAESEKYNRLAEMLKTEKPQSFADYARVFKELTPENVTKALEKASYRDKVWFRDNFKREFEQLRKHELNRIVQLSKYTKGTDPRASKILDQLVGEKKDPRITELWLSPEEINTLKELWWLHRKLPHNLNPSGTGGRIQAHEFLAGLVSPKFLAVQLGKAGGEHAFLKAIRPRGIAPSAKVPKNFAEGGAVMGAPSLPPPNMGLPAKPSKEAFAQAVLQPPEIQQAQKLAEAALRGDKMISNSVKSIFDHKSSYKIPTPTPKSVEKVKEYVKHAQENPSVLLDTGHSEFPEMSGTFSRSIASAVGYLGSLQPPQPQSLPFDKNIKTPPTTHNDIYNHVLKITEQPLYILEKVKQGTVIPEEVGAIKTIYPTLYQRLSDQITGHLVDAGSKGAVLPYRTKLGLSAFFGSPIDTTMTPEAIQSAQPQQQNQPPQGAQTGAQPKRSTSALGKMPTMAQTPGQARSAERSSGK